MKQDREGTLVIHMGALGDLVLALAAIEELARSGPVEAWGPSVERLSFALAPRGPLARVRTLPHALFQERKDGRDEVFSGFARIVAFLKEGSGEEADPLRARVLAAGGHVVSPFREGMHASDCALDGLRACGLARADAPAFPTLRASSEDLALARSHLEKRGVRGSFLAVHPGAGGKRKRWPAERFAEAAIAARDALRAEKGETAVVVLLGAAELDGPRDPALALPGTASAVFEMPSPGELLGILSLAPAFLGNDAGVAHLAAALGTPSVVLFGPTDPALWAPRGKGSISCLRALSGKLDDLSISQVSSELVRAARVRLPHGENDAHSNKA